MPTRLIIPIGMETMGCHLIYLCIYGREMMETMSHKDILIFKGRPSPKEIREIIEKRKLEALKEQWRFLKKKDKKLIRDLIKEIKNEM
jgi:hypothetical protein